MPPWTTELLDGETLMLKSACAAAVTTSVAVPDALSDPLVPFTVMVELPVAVVEATVTVMVEDPEPLIVVGENAAVAPVGRPLAANVTVPVNPFTAVTVAV